MLKTLRAVGDLLTPRERSRGILLLAMVVVMAFFEAAGVASVMPFLAVLGDPESIEKNPLLQWAYSAFAFDSVNSFLVALAGFSLGIVLFGAAFRVITQYAMNRYVHMRRHSIGDRLLETYLRQPYVFFLARNSGDLAKSILSEVDTLILHVFRPLFDMIAYGFVGLAIIVLLVVIDPLLAGLIGLFVGGIYLVVFLSIRGILGRIGADRVDANRDRFTAAGEAISGIKEIKLLGVESSYLQSFRGPSVRYARHQATHQTLSVVPKYVIEGVGVGGILLLSVFLLQQSGQVAEILPILGLYAFAGYRLLPAAQRVYAGFAGLRFGVAAIEEVRADLDDRAQLAEIAARPASRLAPEKDIALDQVFYTYPGAPRPSLSGLDLRVPVGSSVGIVGGTGAGKTTLVDVLLGLLEPERGALAVDGQVLSGPVLRDWQSALGYVPQQIFLQDATVAENVALGVAESSIDMQRVEEACRTAQLHDFIEAELPDGYQTQIGEDGARLSGGQRQRIGVARALYRDPAVLVLDEATSALDNTTERQLIRAILSLTPQKTLLMIAHRLSTVEHCDKVLLLERGRAAAFGTFAEVVEASDDFRAMAAGLER